MTIETLSEALQAELKLRMTQTEKAVDLLRSAADRLEAGRPGEGTDERAQRLRGSAVLAHTAALELAAVSGFVEAVAVTEGAK
jgi:hypothetical protein